MYGCDCPYCKHNNNFWEVGGCTNKYVPVVCEKCKKIFYFLQRSWFDPYYDNTDVEIRKKEWVEKKHKNKELEVFGSLKNKDGEFIANIYNPTWDLYEKFGGKEKVLERLKAERSMFN